MESSALNFQSALQSLTFKTFYHNQAQQFGYDDLFLNRRVVVFSVPSMFGRLSFQTLKNFQEQSLEGIDAVYCVNSNNPLIGPWVDKHTESVIGLYDAGEFVSAVARSNDINKNIDDLKNHWQYFVIINNGRVEKLWHNPVKDNMSLSVSKNFRYAYHGLSIEKVKEYLAISK